MLGTATDSLAFGDSPAPSSSELQRQVARLFNRAGFGARRDEIQRWAARGYEATVNQLLGFPPAATRLDNAELASIEAKAPAPGSGKDDISILQHWWFKRMVDTPYPLEERLTLHWHGHFATANDKVDSSRLMARQLKLLREHAAGDFRQLCNRLHVDAAMLTWLDGNWSQSGSPNENYGREFMELFSLGRARYTQQDVREVARAFTGYSVDDQGAVGFDSTTHDQDPKTILGRGPENFGANDITDIVLDHHPEGAVAAYYVARRLAKNFYRPDPELAVIDAMARSFQGAPGAPFPIGAMVRTLFMRPEFISGPALNIKSPIELVVGTVRGLDLDPAADDFVYTADGMGQQLLNPPNVAGWSGGKRWANTASALARYNFAARASELTSDALVSNALAGAGGDPRGTQQVWMDRLGLLQLLPDTASALSSHFDTSAAANDDPMVVARGALTLLLASPDHNLR